MPKKILMVAGPNGSGKTTMVMELIDKGPTLYEFINADEIAKGLAPLHPENMTLTASKLMIQRLKELLQANKSFAFETTAAGINYIKHLKMAKAKGYEVNLVFLWLSSPEQAIERVAERVKQGGHHIPEETIVRRYYAGLKNLITTYLPFADTAIIMDNSSEKSLKRLIARKNEDGSIKTFDKAIWERLEGEAYER